MKDISTELLRHAYKATKGDWHAVGFLVVRAAAEIGAAAKKGTPQPQTQHNKTPQNVLITTDQKFTQTQQKQSKNKL